MTVLYGIIIFLLIAAIVGTLLLTSRSDDNYRSSTKKTVETFHLYILS